MQKENEFSVVLDINSNEQNLKHSQIDKSN